jgi:hypothetical protein
MVRYDSLRPSPMDRAAGNHTGYVSFPSEEWRTLADILFYGIAFVFLGLCLLYVRAADKL